jgi:hypothetical protein
VEQGHGSRGPPTQDHRVARGGGVTGPLDEVLAEIERRRRTFVIIEAG